MISIVLLLCVMPAFAQIESISLTVDKSDAAVVAWLDSLEARDRAARGHLSDSTAVAYLQQVVDGTLGLPDSIDVRMDSLTVIRVVTPDSMARPLDFSLVGGVTVLPDSIGGEHWARIRFSATKTGATRKLITGAVGVAVREWGAYALSPTEIRIARAPGQQFLEDFAEHLAQ